jgi:hypothetical protein
MRSVKVYTMMWAGLLTAMQTWAATLKDAVGELQVWEQLEFASGQGPFVAMSERFSEEA